MNPKKLFLSYSFIITLFSFNFLTEAGRFLNPEISISLAFLVTLLLGNSLAFVALCSALAQKKKSFPLGLLLLVLLLNIGFGVFVKTSFVVGADSAYDIAKLDISFVGHFTYLFNGFLTLIFMPATHRYRFFIPTTILYYGLLGLAIGSEVFFLVLIMIWSLITGENIYLG